MKKAINILLIAILSIVFIGLVLFVVSFAKDTLFNNETKAHSSNKNQVSNKKDNKDKKTKKKTNNSNDNVQQDLNNNQSAESSTQTTTNQTNSEEDPNNVMQYDKNGDGFVSTSEMTPEAWKLVNEGKLQPTSDAMTKEWSTSREQNKMSQSELDSLSKSEQEGIGYNPNNPRGDVGGPGMSPAHEGIGNDDEE